MLKLRATHTHQRVAGCMRTDNAQVQGLSRKMSDKSATATEVELGQLPFFFPLISTLYTLVSYILYIIYTSTRNAKSITRSVFFFDGCIIDKNRIPPRARVDDNFRTI